MMRQAARVLAEQAYNDALVGMFGFIARRIEWRRANAHLLALEAEKMIDLLRAADKVSFRRARIWTWSRRYRRHAARAWASDRLTATRCLGAIRVVD